MKNIPISVFILFFSTLSVNIYSQQNNYYEKTFQDIRKMLNDESSLNFQRAVYLTENAWHDGGLDQNNFSKTIEFYADISRLIMETGNIQYAERDYKEASAQCAVFVLMTDTIPVLMEDNIFVHYPFQYNYEDFAGQKDWTNMFVTKMIETNKGNCHSMPYLYKMIMDELGYKSYLALAPNHIYIKAHNLKAGWYNIELTCGGFPSDAWLMASGYIHTDAVRNGLYLEELDNKQSVALCLIDLAQGFQYKYGINEDISFILQCCDTALKYFPNYINAMLLKTEALTHIYNYGDITEKERERLVKDMTELASTIHDLGYRKMPEGMYLNWLNSLSENESNKNANSIIIRQ